MPESDLTLSQEKVPVSSIHSNTSQVIITITQDKLQYILSEYTRGLENKKPWLTILALMLTLVGLTLTDISNDYEIPITKDIWRGAWGGLTFATICWLGWSSYKSFLAWRDRNKMTVESVIERIKAPVEEK